MKTSTIFARICIICLLALTSYEGYSQFKVNYNGYLQTVPNYNENKARNYIDKSSSLDDIEGIWETDNFKYSIEKVPGSNTRYRGVVLEAEYNNAWKPGYIHFYIERTATEGVFQMTYYMTSTDFGNRTINVHPERITLIQSSFGMAGFSYYIEERRINRNLIKMYPYEKKSNFQNIEQQPSCWSGSGFALNNGYIVTNYHVIEDANKIIVKGIKGSFTTAYDAEVVATDKYNDLALLKIKDSRFTGFGIIPYKVKTSTSEVGEEIFVLGYPLTSTMGDEIKLTTGVISSKTGFQGDVSLYQISAPVQPGNSGGPLFDSKGNLIGVVSSKHTGAENVGYAIKASYLNTLVESAVSSSTLPSNNTISGQPLTGKVKAVKGFVFMIECSK